MMEGGKAPWGIQGCVFFTQPDSPGWTKSWTIHLNTVTPVMGQNHGYFMVLRDSWPELAFPAAFTLELTLTLEKQRELWPSWLHKEGPETINRCTGRSQAPLLGSLGEQPWDWMTECTPNKIWASFRFTFEIWLRVVDVCTEMFLQAIKISMISPHSYLRRLIPSDYPSQCLISPFSSISSRT